MSLELPSVPNLIERVVGSDLIVIGRVAAVRDIRPAEGFERPHRFGFFEVEVTSVLYGRPPDPLIVRVLSEPEDPSRRDDRPKWSAPMETDVPVVLLLARDVAPELPGVVHVPYFASVFPVENDESVVLTREVLDERTREIARADARGRLRLDDLRRVVEAITTERDARRRAVEALLPPRLIRDPYPLVLEQAGVAQPSQRGPLEEIPGGGRPGEEEG